MGNSVPPQEQWLHECNALRLRIDDRQRQIDSVGEFLTSLQSQQSEDERMLEEIEGLWNKRPQLRIETLDKRLQGERLRQIAREIVTRELGDDAVLHYRDWYRLIREHGYDVSGKDPLASFLTQVSRDPWVERVREQRGFYRVRVATT